MTIEEAVQKLQERLGEPDVFNVRHATLNGGETIVVDVNFIYRVDEVKAAADELALPFPVTTGRRSCW